MKSSIILASALATMAMASAEVKHEVKTEVVYQFVTVTETATGPSPTAVATTAEATTAAGQFYSAPEESAAPEDTSVYSAPAEESAPASAPPSTPASSTDYSGLSDYAAPILQAHNKARAQHSAPDLEWDDNLAAIAQTIGQTCIYQHNTAIGGISYGQNIAAGAGPGDINGVIYNSMYAEEIATYTAWGGEPDINSLGDWGHATQIIWKSSTKVGCATVQCGTLVNAKGMAPEFTVCNYSPAGNMIGAFAQNVLSN